jgi:hypothetical protein
VTDVCFFDENHIKNMVINNKNNNQQVDDETATG